MEMFYLIVGILVGLIAWPILTVSFYRHGDWLSTGGQTLGSAALGVLLGVLAGLAWPATILFSIGVLITFYIKKKEAAE